jgi:hypothetical protein
VEQYERPDWEPLRGIAGDELLGYFMWMHEVRLRKGTAVHAYKHIDTRCYVHLSRDGTGYAYVGDDRYRPVPTDRLFWGILMNADPADELQRAALQAAVEHCERMASRATSPPPGSLTG